MLLYPYTGAINMEIYGDLEIRMVIFESLMAKWAR